MRKSHLIKLKRLYIDLNMYLRINIALWFKHCLLKNLYHVFRAAKVDWEKMFLIKAVKIMLWMIQGSGTISEWHAFLVSKLLPWLCINLTDHMGIKFECYETAFSNIIAEEIMAVKEISPPNSILFFFVFVFVFFFFFWDRVSLLLPKL